MKENSSDLFSIDPSSELNPSDTTNIVNKQYEDENIWFNTNAKVNFFIKELTELRTDFESSANFHYLLRRPLTEKSESDWNILLSEGNVLKGWKLVETLSARLIEYYDNIVVLECLIDKENHLYEEREFEIFLFEGFKLEAGKYFKVCKFQKPNQVMLEIKENPGLILESDFPNIDFANKFGHIKFTKNKT